MHVLAQPLAEAGFSRWVDLTSFRRHHAVVFPSRSQELPWVRIAPSALASVSLVRSCSAEFAHRARARE